MPYAAALFEISSLLASYMLSENRINGTHTHKHTVGTQNNHQKQSAQAANDWNPSLVLMCVCVSVLHAHGEW